MSALTMPGQPATSWQAPAMELEIQAEPRESLWDELEERAGRPFLIKLYEVNGSLPYCKYKLFEVVRWIQIESFSKGRRPHQPLRIKWSAGPPRIWRYYGAACRHWDLTPSRGTTPQQTKDDVCCILMSSDAYMINGSLPYCKYKPCVILLETGKNWMRRSNHTAMHLASYMKLDEEIESYNNAPSLLHEDMHQAWCDFMVLASLLSYLGVSSSIVERAVQFSH